MGKFFAFACLALLAVSATASERTEVNGRGEVRVVNTDVEVWRDLTKEEVFAVASPGKEIPADIKVSTSERDGFFHNISISKYTKVVVFADNRIQTLEKTGEIRGERTLAIYVIFCLISVFFMLISNIVKWLARKDVFAAVAAAAVAVVFAAVAAVVFATVAAAVFTVVAVAAALVAITDARDKRPYAVCAAVYYAAMAVALFI